jgi:hypothetical protein
VNGKVPERILSTMIKLGEDLKVKETREKDPEVFGMNVLAKHD